MNFKEMIFDGDLSFYEDVINSSHIFVSKEVSTASEDAKDTSSWLKDLTTKCGKPTSSGVGWIARF